MLHIKQKNVYPADIQQFGQVCCCFVLLPWPACWSRMITLATFLKDYSNLRRVKYFLPLIDLFLYALPEKKKKLPVNKFHALGSEFDWEGLAQSTSSNLFKAERTRSSMFETKTLLSFPTEVTVLYGPAHLDSALSQMFFIPLSTVFLFVALIEGTKKEQELRSGCISVLSSRSRTLLLNSILLKRSVQRHYTSFSVNYVMKLEKHSRK